MVAQRQIQQRPDEPLKIADRRRASNSVRRARAAATRQQALDLRIQGRSFRAIAALLDCGLGTAHRWVEQAAREQAKLLDRPAAFDAHRAIQIARLETGVRAIWPAVLAGDPGAVRQLVSLILAEARLVGTLKPA